MLGLPTILRAERPDDRAPTRVHDPAEVCLPGELSHAHERQGGPAEAGRGTDMIPYADFLYFGIFLYIALPTLLIRRWLGFSRAWVLLATAAMLLVQYGTTLHLLPVTSPESFGVKGGFSAAGGLAEI